MAIQNFNSKDDFLLWVKQRIKEDKEFLYNENMPPWFLARIKLKEIDIFENTYSDYMEYYFSFGLPKTELKKILKNLNRLESMRANQFIDLELFEKNINKVLDAKIISYINDITDIDIKDIEPHQYYIFFNTVEEINFFIGSKIIRYEDLFSIKKDKFDIKIQKLKDNADNIAYCFDEELIDHQIRIRLPLNPKVVISRMFFYLTVRGSATFPKKDIARYFYDCLVEYFIGEENKKIVSEKFHYDFSSEMSGAYCVKDERSFGNYSHYFYEPSIKQNYNYRS